MKKILILFSIITLVCTAFAQQRTPIVPATEKDSAYFPIDKDGKIYADSFRAILDPQSIAGLQSQCIQTVRNFNSYIGELWKTWDEAKKSGKYASKQQFEEEKIKYGTLAKQLFLFDANPGVASENRYYRCYFDANNNSYYRYYDKKPARHVIYKDGVYKDSVWEDVEISPVTIEITSKYSSRGRKQFVRNYIKNIQDLATRDNYGFVEFNGGGYLFTSGLKWNETTKRYEGVIDYWQTFERTTPEGYGVYSDRTHRRIAVYVIPEFTHVDGKTYVGWTVKLGDIRARKTEPLY